MPRLSLYHYPSCYFCRVVRQVMDQHNFDIELRDIHQNRDWQSELIAARGRRTVPVMRIEDDAGNVQWLPESRDIVRYLQGLAAAS